MSLTCEADGVLCDAREAEIPAGETAGVSFSIPETAKVVRVSLREKDALAADNTAETACEARRDKDRGGDLGQRVPGERPAGAPGPDGDADGGVSAASTEADLYILGTSR